MSLESKEGVQLEPLICEPSAHRWEMSLECELDYPGQGSRGKKRESMNSFKETQRLASW